MQNTQQKIIDAAIQVFNEDLSAALEKVAERASVTRRTLHRYFKDRNELIALCEKDMQRSCNNAMLAALNSSDDSLKQLENMLYAGIDCGAKYSFFRKLHTRQEHKHNHKDKDCAEYDAMYERYRNVMLELQDRGIISKNVTIDWVTTLFGGVITATINAVEFGSVARTNLKEFAWFSFSKGIGI
jgi:AcrR family transcriptional regulator